MNQTIVPNSGPKLRLVEAAEKLFAEKGFESVSVRDITKEAGANVAAVNYHFGSRDGLVVAVMSRYMTPVNQERLVRLEQVEKSGVTGAAGVEAILSAFVKPLVEHVGRSELSEKLYCQLVGRIFGDQVVEMPNEVELQTKNLIDRFVKALAKAMPELTPEEIIWRLHFAAGGMIHLLTHTDFLYRIASAVCGTPPMDQTIDRFIRFGVAGICEGTSEELEGQTVKPKTPQALFNF